MVTINVTGSSVEFTFQNSPYYLSNGTITVPKNSLALTIDSSDMVTYKKAASNDIFISVPLSELDMTKQEVVEQFYSMCTTGGGGVTSGEVETMIDEAISGKADSSDVETLSGTVTAHTSDSVIHVTSADKTAWDAKLDSSALAQYYTSAQTDSAITAAVSGKADSSAVTEEISTAVSGKADSSAVTEEISAAVSGKADSSAVTASINAAVSGKADSSAVTEEISAAVSGKADTSALTVYFDDAKYEMSGQTHVINFYNGQTVKATINADDFIKDGMVDDVEVENGYLVITFNTDSGKQPISIPLTDIFDPSNYYTTGQTDNLINAAVSGKADTSAVTAAIDASEYVTAQALIDLNTRKPDSSAVTAEITAAVSGKADNSTVVTLSGQVTANTASITNKADTSALTAHTSDTTIHVTSSDKTAWDAKLDSSALTDYYTSAQTDSAITAAVSGKQDTLSAGTNITIVDNVISATGGGSVTVDQTLNSGSTNPVSNSAVTNNTLSGNVETSSYFRSFRFWKNNGTASLYMRYAAINGYGVLVDGTSPAPDFSLVETSAVTTSLTSGSTDSQVPSAKAVYDQLGGVKIVALSQQAYDALAPDYDANTLYIINS